MLFLYFFCFGFPLPHRHSVCWAENEELFFKKSFAVPFLSHLPRGALKLMMPGRSPPLNIRFLWGMGVYMRLEKNGGGKGTIVDTGDGFYVGICECAYHTSCDAEKGSLLGTTLGAYPPTQNGDFFFWGGGIFSHRLLPLQFTLPCSFVQFLEKRNISVRTLLFGK